MSAELMTPVAVMAALTRHIGPEQGVTAVQLTQEVAGLFASKADERRLRGVIEQLRREGHGICGTPETGYHLAADEADLINTCEFLYSRVKTTVAQIAAMRKVSQPDLRGQLRLPQLPHPADADNGRPLPQPASTHAIPGATSPLSTTSGPAIPGGAFDGRSATGTPLPPHLTLTE